MTQKSNSTTQPNPPLSLAKPILIGAGFGLFLISFILLGVKDLDTEWVKLWMINPLIVVPTAGAVGGMFYSFVHHLNSQGKWNKALAIVLSL